MPKASEMDKAQSKFEEIDSRLTELDKRVFYVQKDVGGYRNNSQE